MRSKFSSFFAVIFAVVLMTGAFVAAQETPEQKATSIEVITTEAPTPAATEATATAPAQDKPLNIERFDIKDVNGRLVHGKDLEGWIILYGFGTEKTADQSLDFLKRLTKEEPRAEGVLYVCIADTSSHNSPVLRPLVKKILKKEYRKQINILEESYAKWGIEPPAKLENRYLLVADMKADLFDMFGIADQKDKPHLFIMDGKYRVRGHYTDFSDEVADAFRFVLAERETDRQFALKSHAKKKKTWKKYALIGGAVALYFVLND